MKLINEIRILTEPDPDPDLSCLGFFSDDNPAAGEHYIDRRTNRLYGPGGEPLAESSRRPRGIALDYPSRYFIPGPNHIPHDPSSWADVGNAARDKAVAEYGSIASADYHYALEDWLRRETYETSNWHMIGIQAVAKIVVEGVRQTIRSGGLWGIESDSGKDYLNEVANEQQAELAGILAELGFTKQEISEALIVPRVRNWEGQA